MNQVFIGLTRFSVYIPGSAEWILSVKESEYLEKLFDEERLALKSKIFNSLSLPILRGMAANRNYRHIVQYSENLPSKYKKILLDIEAENSFIYLQLIDSQSSRAHQTYNVAIPEILRQYKLSGVIDSEQTYFGFFVLDDDDLISSSYLDRSAKYVNEHNVGMNISFGRGYTSFYDNDVERFIGFKEVYLPKINIGLMKICSYDFSNQKHIIPKSGSHMTLDKFSPVILDSRDANFLWIRSLVQDTVSQKDDKRSTVVKILNQYDDAILSAEHLKDFDLNVSMFSS